MRYIATAAKCFAEEDTMSLKQLFLAVAAAHSSAHIQGTVGTALKSR